MRWKVPKLVSLEPRRRASERGSTRASAPNNFSSELRHARLNRPRDFVEAAKRGGSVAARRGQLTFRRLAFFTFFATLALPFKKIYFESRE